MSTAGKLTSKKRAQSLAGGRKAFFFNYLVVPSAEGVRYGKSDLPLPETPPAEVDAAAE